MHLQVLYIVLGFSRLLNNVHSPLKLHFSMCACYILRSCSLLCSSLKLKLKTIKLSSIANKGEFHISHNASRQISVFSPRWKERLRVLKEIFNDLNFKMQFIQGKFQFVLLIFVI